MMKKNTSIPGCYELYPQLIKDNRGYFTKTFHQDVFRQLGLRTDFTEEYFTFSNQRVLRGLHFQVPPMDHTKIVYCVAGCVFDAIVDIRIGSPTFGNSYTFELSAEKGNMIYIPPGLAHGFYVLSKHAMLMYKVTTVYSPEHDTGIFWKSAGIPWPESNPIISDRDSTLVNLSAFDSPFHY